MMKYAYITATFLLVAGCIPEDSCQKQDDAEVKEMMELHEERSKDWGYMGKTEVFEGFK
jgi:hypothetical protein